MSLSYAKVEIGSDEFVIGHDNEGLLEKIPALWEAWKVKNKEAYEEDTYDAFVEFAEQLETFGFISVDMNSDELETLELD